MDERESDDALKRRHETVSAAIRQREKALERCTRPGTRTRKAQMIGSLRFTLLGIERELSERGISI